MINKHCVGHYVVVKGYIDKATIDKTIKLFGLDDNTTFENPLNSIKEGRQSETTRSWVLLYVTPEGRLSYDDSISVSSGSTTQRSFEELDIKTKLQTISSPFGELDKQTKKDLLCAWVEGADIEVKYCGIWQQDDGMYMGVNHFAYRVKPTRSTKEDAKAIAKAKLISEAQQQLRDAQEALDKAQEL